jgi:general secretion pathway protein H
MRRRRALSTGGPETPVCTTPAGGEAVRAQARARQRAAGFTLFEVLLGLMLMALVAALVLPRPNRPVGPATLRATAYDVSAVLRNARTAALSAGRPTSTVVDGRVGRIEGAGGRVDLPAGITAGVPDARRETILFEPDGRSNGGAILLATTTARISVAVSAETGSIRLVP